MEKSRKYQGIVLLEILGTLVLFFSVSTVDFFPLQLLLYICGSKEKYRQLRDMHALQTHMDELRAVCDNAGLDTINTETTHVILPYDVLIGLVSRLLFLLFPFCTGEAGHSSVRCTATFVYVHRSMLLAFPLQFSCSSAFDTSIFRQSFHLSCAISRSLQPPWLFVSDLCGNLSAFILTMCPAHFNRLLTILPTTQAFVHNCRCICSQIEHLTACSEIATSHTVNWQKFCQKEDGIYIIDLGEFHVASTQFRNRFNVYQVYHYAGYK